MASNKNLASGVLTAAISSSDTTIVVNSGDAGLAALLAMWPTAPFFITVMPATPDVGVANSIDSEIMEVSAITTTLEGYLSMIVSRGAKGTSAQDFDSGAIVVNGIYADKKLFFINSSTTSGSTTTYTLTDDNAPVAESGAEMFVVFVSPASEITGSYANLVVNGDNSGSGYGLSSQKVVSGPWTSVITIKQSTIYHLVFDGTAWVILNGSELIKADNIDYTTLINKIYPVGSIYMSVNNVSPATFIGGTWVEFAQGKTLIGLDPDDTDFDTVEDTGGEKTHTLTVDEMPSHSHTFKGIPKDQNFSWADPYTRNGYATTNVNPYPAQGGAVNNSGGGGAHNNLQPYVVVYMWKRTA